MKLWTMSPSNQIQRIRQSVINNNLTWFGYGSIPINTIFRGMNIHLPAILMFTRGTRFLTHCHLTSQNTTKATNPIGPLASTPTSTLSIFFSRRSGAANHAPCRVGNDEGVRQSSEHRPTRQDLNQPWINGEKLVVWNPSGFQIKQQMFETTEFLAAIPAPKMALQLGRMWSHSVVWRRPQGSTW